MPICCAPESGLRSLFRPLTPKPVVSIMFRLLNFILSHRFPSAPILVFSAACVLGLLLLVLVAVPSDVFPPLGTSQIVAYSFLVVCSGTTGVYAFVRYRSLHPEVRKSYRDSIGHDLGFFVLGILGLTLAVFLNYVGRNTLAVIHGTFSILLAPSAVYLLTRHMQEAHRESSAIKGLCHRCGYAVRDLPKCPECGEINATTKQL